MVEEDYEEMSDLMILFIEKYSLHALLQIVADISEEVEE